MCRHTVDIVTERLHPVSIVIVDDHPATGVGLATIVAAHPHLRVAASPADIDAALTLDLANVDICILGLWSAITATPGANTDPIARIHARWPRTQVLVYAEHDDDDHLSTYLQSGAAGFISKRATPDEIVAAIDCLARGERHFMIQPPAYFAVSAASRLPQLSTREHEALRMLARGMSVTDIATAWSLSVKTASSHKMNLQRKLGVRSTAQIVPRARELGLL